MILAPLKWIYHQMVIMILIKFNHYLTKLYWEVSLAMNCEELQSLQGSTMDSVEPNIE